MYTSIYQGITFVEGLPPKFREIRPIRVEIGGIFASAQLKNLDDVKRLMAEQVRSAGGNAVVNFNYGQKSVGFWESIFSRDDVNWYGAGSIAFIDIV